MKKAIITLAIGLLCGSVAFGQGTPVNPYVSYWMRTLLDDETQAAAQTTLGLGTGDSPTFTGVTLVNAITEFSMDGIFADDSDLAVPTEKAVKTYVDNNAGSVSPLEMTELSSDPDKPAEGENVIWMSDGTEYGDDGDLVIAATAGGVTKRAVLWDFSGASEWIDFLLLETGDSLLLEIGDKLILEN